MISCQSMSACSSLFSFIFRKHVSSNQDCLEFLIKDVNDTYLMPRGVKKGLDTKKFDMCVTKVKRKSGKKVNPYAVCNASMSGKTRRKK